jgi:NagD protein
MARSIVQRLGLPGSAVAFVGDRLYTDIRMAREQGLVGVLTLTGEATLADLADAPYPPDVIVEDMNHLHALLRLAEVIA